MILRACSTTRVLSLTGARGARSPRRVLRVAGRLRRPAQRAAGAAQPARRPHRRSPRLDDDLRRRLRRAGCAAGAAPPSGSTTAERTLLTAARAAAAADHARRRRRLRAARPGRPAARRRRQPDELQTVLRGLPHNVTTEMDLELWRLAQRIRADAEAAGDAARHLARPSSPRATTPARCRGAAARAGRVPRRVGHRAVAEIDLGLPRWSEDPTHILGVLANYLRLEDPALAPDALFARGAARGRGDDRRAAGAGTPARPAPRRGRPVRAAAGPGSWLGLREMPKYYLVIVLGAPRAPSIAAVGADLAERRPARRRRRRLLPRPRRGAPRPRRRATCARSWRERREAYDQELRRRQVPARAALGRHRARGRGTGPGRRRRAR